VKRRQLLVLNFGSSLTFLLPAAKMAGNVLAQRQDYKNANPNHNPLSDDNLTLLCNESIVQDYLNISDQNGKPSIQVPRYTLADELGELEENGSFTD
ncbi:hypothetical protein HispidOSU_029583, partial [Sigmodon hispidus]